MKSFLQHDLEIAFHLWVTKFVLLQFLRLEKFPVGRRLEGRGDFAAHQPMTSVAVCTGHHSGVLYVSCVTLCVVCLLCHAAELRRSPGGASVWSLGASMLP